MKSYFILTLAAAVVASQAGAAEKVNLADQKAKVSYSIGQSIGNDFKRGGLELDVKILAAGIADALAGTPSQMTEEEMQATMMAFSTEMRAKQTEKAKVAGDKNLKEGEAFLEANKKKEGVKTLPSGLQYKVLKSGTGKSPKATDTVSTHYRGTLIDGTEFDSSIKRNEPATFPVNGVIPGWTEALQMMKVGDKWQLFIPGNLAYGAGGAPGGVIQPNSTLIFDVELLSIQ